MNKLFSILLALQLLGAATAFAQFDQELVSKVAKIQELATTGYEYQDPKKLMAAAKILQDNQHIRSFKKFNTPSTDEPDYFNAKALLKSAYLYTPINKKRKRRKIQKKIDEVSEHIKMGLNDGDLLVEVVKDLKPGEAIHFPYAIGAQKWIELHLEDAKQLMMSLFLEEKSDALKSDAEKNPISYNFQTKTPGNYKIEIKNQSDQQSLSTFFMIKY